MIKRRQFIAGLGSTAAWPLAARAQQNTRVRRIGVLMTGDENDDETTRFCIHASARGLGLDRWPQYADGASVGRR